MADFLEGAPGETISRNVEVEMDRMESNISKQGYTDGFLAGKEEGEVDKNFLFYFTNLA